MHVSVTGSASTPTNAGILSKKDILSCGWKKTIAFKVLRYSSGAVVFLCILKKLLTELYLCAQIMMEQAAREAAEEAEREAQIAKELEKQAKEAKGKKGKGKKAKSRSPSPKKSKENAQGAPTTPQPGRFETSGI